MDMIQTEHYPAEKHTLQTKDGYILTVYRIPNMNIQRTNRKVILFMHGMTLLTKWKNQIWKEKWKSSFVIEGISSIFSNVELSKF